MLHVRRSETGTALTPLVRSSRSARGSASNCCNTIRRLAAEHEPNRDLLREAGALELVLAALADPFAGSAMQLYAREARILLRQ